MLPSYLIARFLRALSFVAFLMLLGIRPSISSESSDIVVVDGDTLILEGTTYRLHGIDAPEAGQKCNNANGGTWRCGDAATKALIALIGESNVQCDNLGQDDYDRTISVCTSGPVVLNEAMVRQGFAWAFRKFSDDYAEYERTARAAGLGIWQAPTETAWSFRKRRWEVGVQSSPEGCPIKGNISRNGRIYHAPWSPWYSRTKVSPEKGERWFCSEREALDAGWRAPIWGG